MTEQRVAHNLIGLDYRREAEKFRRVEGGIVDAHAHINGPKAAEVWAEAAEAYGVSHVFTQTLIGDAPGVRDAIGDRASFVAIPDYWAEDRAYAFGEGFLEAIRRWHGEFGAKMVKLWNAPRFRDVAEKAGLDGLWRWDSPERVRAAEVATDLGMMIMVHVADPNTWFRTKYADVERYGTKASHLAGLEQLMDRVDAPFLVAHMGGWPEDLDFLDAFLRRRPRCVLDTSAAKWQVRELSRHEPAKLRAFLERWRGRIVWGTDIVTVDAHLEATEPDPDRAVLSQASSREEAWDLYASRMWAMRTQFEGGYDGMSPIADPDLAMVEPEKYDAMSSPRLRSAGLDDGMLDGLYRGAVENSLVSWYERGEWETAPGPHA